MLEILGLDNSELIIQGGDMGQGVLDRNTIMRFLQSVRPISQLTYASNEKGAFRLADGEAGCINIHRGGIDWPLCQPIIIPAIDIKSFSAFYNKDMQWWVIRGDQVPRLKPDMMLIAFDFSIPRADRALVFGFTYPETYDWLQFMIKYNHVSITSGPDGYISNSIGLDLSNIHFKSSVLNWLTSCKNL